MESHFSRSFLSRSTSSASLIVPTHQQRRFTVRRRSTVARLQVSDLPFCAGGFCGYVVAPRAGSHRGRQSANLIGDARASPSGTGVRGCARSTHCLESQHARCAPHSLHRMAPLSAGHARYPALALSLPHHRAGSTNMRLTPTHTRPNPPSPCAVNRALTQCCTVARAACRELGPLPTGRASPDRDP